MSRRTSYLQRRGDTLSFRIAIPAALRPHFGECEFTAALGTSDRQVAVPVALELAAYAKRLFQSARIGMSEPRKSKLLDLIREKKAEIRQQELKERYEEQLVDQQLEHRRALEKAQLAAENAALRSALSSLANSKAAPTTDVASAAGTVSSPPQEVTSPHRLDAAIAVWMRLRSPSPASVEVYTAAAKRFEARHAELGIEGLTKKHIRQHIEWLQKQGKKPKTIHKEIGALRTLLNIAIHEDWISTNPASQVLLPDDGDSDNVRAYSAEEARRIFSSPVFSDGLRPVGGKGEAAYWVPILLLFTGARREEICQLTTQSIQEIAGVPAIAIDPRGDDGRVKTKESRRLVPVHRQLDALGLLDFVSSVRKKGGGALFPQLKRNKRGQLGAKWGDWWARYVHDVVGIRDKRIRPSHSFRHLFISECRRLKLREDYERALVGHVGKHSRRDVHDRYGEHDLPALTAEINKIDFRGLDFSHLFAKRKEPKPVMRGT